MQSSKIKTLAGLKSKNIATLIISFSGFEAFLAD
jgi:hypothetical protein